MTAPRTVEILRLGPGDGAVLDRVAPGVFDHPVDPQRAAEFLSDARHHLVVARAGGEVVGFASAVHYVHPDKAPELWINEVGVAPSHHRAGIGRRLMEAVLARGRELGCQAAWVLTERSNQAAQGLYAASGGEGEDVVIFTFALQDAAS